MGCCVSKSSAPSPSKPQHYSQRPRSVTGESRAPPPSAEEETVKEVLSETPRPKPSPIPSPSPNPKLESEHEEDEAEDKIPKPQPVLFPIVKLNDEKIHETTPFHHAAEEISEVSEICSLSESVSATTTLTRDDEDEEVGPRVYRSPMKFKNRAYSGDSGGGAPRRERAAVGRSPTRRSNQSPGRRTGNGAGSVRLVQGREPGQAMTRRGLRAVEQRRDYGDYQGSARRSRSPATNRTDGVGGGVTRSGAGRSSPSARRSVRSPGRVHGTRIGGEDPGVEEGKWPLRPNKTSSNTTTTTTTTDESLENPLVSLECFIFL